jgi:hypothetical protein
MAFGSGFEHFEMQKPHRYGTANYIYFVAVKELQS